MKKLIEKNKTEEAKITMELFPGTDCWWVKSDHYLTIMDSDTLKTGYPITMSAGLVLEKLKALSPDRNITLRGEKL